MSRKVAERLEAILPAGLAPSATASRAAGRPSTTTTAAAETIPATAATAAAKSAIWLRPRFVYVNRSAVQLRSVQSIDRLVGFSLVFHLYERKTSRTPRVPICHDASAADDAETFEQAAHRLFR